MTEISPLKGGGALTREEAREITGRIRQGLVALGTLKDDIDMAFERRIWDAFEEYPSWDAYVKGEFTGSFPQFNRVQRHELVLALKQTGLSNVTTAAVLGVGEATVRRDVANIEATSPNDEVALPDRIVGADGRARPASLAKKPPEVKEPTAVIPPEDVEDEPGETCTPLSAFPISFKSSKDWIDRLLRTKEVRGNLDDLRKTKRMLQKAIKDLEKLERELDQ